ncbi:GNAT family N-acetyltransferase [soil metagenome]
MREYLKVPSALSFRLASRDDAVCLHALGTQVFLETYATEGIRPSLAREAQSHSSVGVFERLLTDAQVRILLAETNGHLVAFAEVHLRATQALVTDQPAAELVRLYVQSPFLRRGIGAQLLRRSESTARDSGAVALWLTAWSGNARARAFYVACGYEDLGATSYAIENETYENRVFVKSVANSAPTETRSVR